MTAVRRLKGRRVAVLAADGFEKVELSVPVAALRAAGAEVVHVSAIGAGGDVETVAAEKSYAYTASHTAALARLARPAGSPGGGRSADRPVLLPGLPSAQECCQARRAGRDRAAGDR